MCVWISRRMFVCRKDVYANTTSLIYSLYFSSYLLLSFHSSNAAHCEMIAKVLKVEVIFLLKTEGGKCKEILNVLLWKSIDKCSTIFLIFFLKKRRFWVFFFYEIGWWHFHLNPFTISFEKRLAQQDSLPSLRFLGITISSILA